MPTPNTDFSPGTTLTATQLNRFPRGIVAYAQQITNQTGITTEAVTLTSPTFTAVANRYYKITYYEPQMTNGTNCIVTARIRQTNISGTTLNTRKVSMLGGTHAGYQGITEVIAVTTFTAGSQVVVSTLAFDAGTGAATRVAATQVAFLLVEDIGPV